jgi:hypothetical protein
MAATLLQITKARFNTQYVPGRFSLGDVGGRGSAPEGGSEGNALRGGGGKCSGRKGYVEGSDRFDVILYKSWPGGGGKGAVGGTGPMSSTGS